MKIKQLRAIAKILGVTATDGRKSNSIYQAIRQFYTTIPARVDYNDFSCTDLRDGRSARFLASQSITERAIDTLKRAYTTARFIKADDSFKTMILDQIKALKKVNATVMFKGWGISQGGIVGAVDLDGKRYYVGIHTDFWGKVLKGYPEQCFITLDSELKELLTGEALHDFTIFVQGEYLKAWDQYSTNRTGKTLEQCRYIRSTKQAEDARKDAEFLKNRQQRG